MGSNDGLYGSYCCLITCPQHSGITWAMNTDPSVVYGSMPKHAVSCFVFFWGDLLESYYSILYSYCLLLYPTKQGT